MAEPAVGRPVRARAEVLWLRNEGGENRRLALAIEGWPGFEPGQFVMLSPGPLTSVRRSDPLLPRPMAVYRERTAAGGAHIEILFKRQGRGTALLAESAPGQQIELLGPLGRPFTEPAPEERPVLVGGGTGVASIYALAARLAARGRPAEVLLGAGTASDLMAEADFAELGVALRVATEDGSRGHRGLVTELLVPALEAPGAARVYACGPTGMMQRCAELATERGHSCAVSLENPMACGFGVCLGCAAPLRAGGFALVCRDGPVFEASAVDWEGLP
ncbi:MAG TPA: dihydroorotate dehydrogenase electron transfer subunit [Myxococcota bacterium]